MVQRGKCNGRVVMYWMPDPPICKADLEKYGPPITMSETGKAVAARRRELRLARKK